MPLLALYLTACLFSLIGAAQGGYLGTGFAMCLSIPWVFVMPGESRGMPVVLSCAISMAINAVLLFLLILALRPPRKRSKYGPR